MDYCKPPSTFNVHEPHNWNRWKQSFTIFLLAIRENEADDAVKIALLLNQLGDSCLDIYNTFDVSKKNKFEDVMSCFDDRFLPRQNICMETYKFNSIEQKDGQSIDDYITELKKQAANCSFVCQNQTCKKSFEDRMLRDRLVIGIKDKQVQRHLLRENDLSLEKMQDYCKSIEVTLKNVELLQSNSNNEEVDAVRYSKTNRKCSRCGTEHPPRKCPAFRQICKQCQKEGHFAKMCFWKNKTTRHGPPHTQHRNQGAMQVCIDNQVGNNMEVKSEENVSTDDSLFIYECKHNSKHSWYESIRIHDVSIRFKLDTGADSSILPLKHFKHLNIDQSKIVPTSMTIISYGNFRSKPLGFITLKCKFKDIIENVKFLVVNFDSEPLLGLNDCLLFKMISRINSIHTKILNESLPKDAKELYTRFRNVFEGLGCIPGLVEIKLRHDAIPVIQSQRKIPLVLHERLKQTLNDLEEKGVVSKVDYPTEWVNSLMIVEKPNGSLRLCLDPKPLNKFICREHYIIPKCDDILTKLEGKTIFSVIDMKDGFWQIQLSKNSSDLCTFNTPFGRYKFNRVPFGLNSIPEIFQKKNIEIFGDIPNVSVYFDDIIIYGSNESEHDTAFKRVLEKALHYNIKFNFNKLQYKMAEVEFLGQNISKLGVKPSQKNIEAVLAIETPSNKKDLLRILGLFKFFSKFISNLSQLTYNMRNLTRNDIKFKWSESHQHELETLKTLITNKPILKIFDRNSPIEIQTDASSKGIGSCMIQNGYPISFASRSLNKAEVNYAQIEKELLSIVFSCEKFHYWIYGREVVIKTDHKPLIAIFNKNLDNVSARLQRMLLKLLKYHIKVEYLPGSKMYVADTLSRSYIKSEVPIDKELEYTIHSLSLAVPMTKEKIKQFQNCIDSDSTLSKVKEYCMKGWPIRSKKLNSELKYYYKLKDNIYLSDNLLLYNHKVVVPLKLRAEMLKLIHSAHFGIEKCKLRAREILIWPGMSRDIENFVSNCEICQAHRANNQKETLVPHKIPQRPWEILFSDFFEYKSKNYLIIVDSFSHWLEVFPTTDKTAKTVIDCCKEVFSKFGVPDIFYSDNMPYNSVEFKNFSRAWNFEIEFSSPHHHESNGFAEKYVAIAKNMLKKMNKTEELPYYLLEYRNTPLPRIGYAPAQLLLNRLVKTKFPVSSNKLLPKILDQREIVSKLIQNSDKTQQLYNKNAKDLPPLEKNDNILFKKNDKWNKGKVLNRYNDRSYMIKDENGKIFRRNRKFMNKTNVSVKTSDPYLEDLLYETPLCTTNNRSHNLCYSAGATVPRAGENAHFTDSHPSQPSTSTETSHKCKISRPIRERRVPYYFRDYEIY